MRTHIAPTAIAIFLVITAAGAAPTGNWVEVRSPNCTELRGHTAKLIFTPSAVKWYNGELVHIEIEK